jgi:hypothetical protein
MTRVFVLILLLLLPLAAQTPPPEIDPWLSHLEGDWNIVREIRGTRASNRATADWILDRRFLRIHMVDTSPAKTYEAIVTIGYVPGKKQYVAYWLDSFGPAYSAVGWGTRRGETVEFTFHYDDGPFYNTFSWDAASHQWTSLMENGAKDGQRTFFARDTWSQRR